MVQFVLHERQAGDTSGAIQFVLLGRQAWLVVQSCSCDGCACSITWRRHVRSWCACGPLAHQFVVAYALTEIFLAWQQVIPTSSMGTR